MCAAAAGKASKGEENNPLPAYSASFTSLHEAEQKKDLLQCASILRLLGLQILLFVYTC